MRKERAVGGLGMALVLALFAQSAVAVGAGEPPGAAAATLSGEAAADLGGTFYLQSVVSGYNMSGSGDWVATHKPKGDEDAQQWEFSPNPDGTYKIANPSRSGECLTEQNNPEGEPRLVLGPCDAAKTNWELRHEKGERYQIYVPGTGRRLWGEPVLDSPMQVKITEDEIANQSWFLTPIDPVRAPMPPDPTLDDMTFLTTHNAMHNTEDNSDPPFPNQPHSVARQLSDGARALMLDAHYANGNVRFCHEIAVINECGVSVPASDIFSDINDFMRQDPNAIVTVFLEDYTTPDQLHGELADELAPGSSLGNMVFRPDAQGVRDNGWPTVSSMRASGKRLLLFTADTGASDTANRKNQLGFMSQRDWTVENYWSMGAGLGASNWNCYSRWDEVPLSTEEPGFRRLHVMNHFRDTPVAPTYRTDNEKLQNRAERFCMPAARKKPNFLAIDEYKDGDPMAAVNALNTYTYHGDTPGMGGTPSEDDGGNSGAGDPFDTGADDRVAKPAVSGGQAQCRPEGLAATSGVDTRYCDVYDADGREWLGGNGHDRRVVGYFTGWRTGEDGDPRYLVKNIPWTRVSHINYAFAHVDGGNRISVGDTADPDNPATGMTWPGVNGAEMDNSLSYHGHFNLLTRYKRQHPRVKTLISVGGWAESRNFYTMATNADGSVNQAGIDTFADSVTAFLDRYGFDGVDIDYEYPTALPDSGNPNDWALANGRRKGLQAGYNALMKTLREKLDRASAGRGRYYLLTSAGSASGYLVRGYDAGQALQYQDFVNVMSYDLHGSWNKYVGPQAPLYDDGRDPELADAGIYGQPEFDRTGYFNVDWAYHYYRGALPPGRINLGIPYYTRGWQNVTGGASGLWGTSQLPDQSQCQPGTGTETPCGYGAEGIDNVWHDLGTRGEEVASGSNPLWHARNLQEGITPGYLESYIDTGSESGQLTGTYEEHYSDNLKAAWLWNPRKKVFLSTENNASIDAKVRYVDDHGIGGVMLWELAGDSTRRSNGEYGMGYDMTRRVDESLRGSGGYGTARAGGTQLPNEVVDVTVRLVEFPTAEADLWPIQPKLRITNNTGTALPAGTKVSFDIPTTTSPLLKDEGWTVLTGAVAPGRGGANIGGLGADFHRVTLTLGYCEAIPAGKSHDIGLKYYLPITGPANITVTTNGHTYGSVQDGRESTTTVRPDTGTDPGCQAPTWRSGTAHGRTVGRVWAAWDKGQGNWQFEYQGGVMDHNRGENRAHLVAPVAGNANQQWLVRAVSGGWYTIANASRCLTASAARRDITTATCGGGDNQKWHLVPINAATGAEGPPGAPAHGALFTLRSATGLDIEAAFGETTPGTHLWGGATNEPATGAYVAWKGFYWAASWWTTVEPGTPERDSTGREVFPWKRLGPTP